MVAMAVEAARPSDRSDGALRTSQKLQVSKSTLFNFAVLRGDAARDDPIQEEYEPITVDGKTITPTKVMQSLEPRVGRCYVGNEQLLPAVRLWRERQPYFALKVLEKVQADAGMDAASVALARSLIVDIAQMHDMYTFIHENARDILTDNPQDVHARFVMALYDACAQHTGNPSLSMFKPGKSDAVESSKEWKKLHASSPFFAKLLSRVADDVKSTWDKNTPVDVVPVETVAGKKFAGKVVIGVFGWGPVKGKEGHYYGTPPMKQRVDAALKLAHALPDAQIIASGGAVTSGKAEGEFIQEDLVRQDADLKDRIIVDPKARDSQGNALFIGQWFRDNAKDNATLLIVGSDWQDPRFKAIMDGTFEAMDVKANIVLVGAGNDFVDGANDPKLKGRIAVEQTAIWRDAARALGYFETCDFVEDNAQKSGTSLPWPMLSLLLSPLLLIGAAM